VKTRMMASLLYSDKNPPFTTCPAVCFPSRYFSAVISTILTRAMPEWIDDYQFYWSVSERCE
jgi:hypothetical protein